MSSAPSISKRQFSQPSEEQARRKKKRTQRIIAAIVLSLVGLTAIENYFLEQQTTAPIANNIAILAVFNIILILLFVLIVLITRNLVKLYNERKSKIIGSKFQTKLIIAFLILALVPSTLLFMTASKLFTYSIGSWFNLQVEQTLQRSMDVARDYYSHLEKGALARAQKIENFITRNELFLQKNRAQLEALAKEKVEEYDLNGLIVYDNQKKIVVSVFNQKINPQARASYQDLLKESVGGEGVSEIRSTNQGTFLVVMDPLKQLLDGKISVWGYILTLTPIPQNSLGRIEAIRSTFEDYKQQSFLKLPVSASYYITFFLITLLILFSAIWLGFYMARGITIPIQELAEGTRRIAEGDLSFKIGVHASDEIGILVDSFNKMTNQLNESQISIQHAHEDLKVTNLELEQRRYYIETILENIGAGVVSVDKKGHITTFNKAAEKILGVQAEDVFGSSYKEAFGPSFHEPIRKMTKRMDQQQKGSMKEHIDLRVGEDNLTLLVNIQVLKDTDEKYLGLVIVFEDLTQLIKTEKIAAWKEVAQGIAHEIKNPLTPIQLNTQRLQKKYHEDKKDFARVFEESIAIICQEVEGMKDMLNEFQRFSRMPAPNPKPASLHKIIDDVSILYSDYEKKVTINKQFDQDIGFIKVDAEQMRRVFINLFENALDAMEQDGKIDIITRLNQKEKQVQIDFSDNGSGIAPEDMNKLFLPHFTTKKRGSGLGLAIVNRIIVDHNGTILVKENSPKGSRFVIDLPYSLVSMKTASPSTKISPQASSSAS
ncbi:MAG: PAS domain-containing sensor histidine kinase [Nitrospinaceae bacterium]|nr:MAG: PAS domain-containing sensor histidine kinase [Nitrospinaceae bacterium]